MKLSRQLRMLYFALAAIVFSVIAVHLMAPRPRSAEPISPPPVSPVSPAVAGSGLVEPRSENLSISNPVAGVIVRVAVAPHDRVEKGDVLFELETRHLHSDLSARRQMLLAAKAAAGDARMKLNFLSGVNDTRAIRKEELESRRFEAERAAARVAQAQAEVERLEVEIERQLVRAPIDGEILRVEARPGEFAPAGRIDPPLIVMGDTTRLHVRAEIPEDLAWRISPAGNATASPRGRGDLALPLEFVRFEPFVRPKQSLTGNPDERVDTRVVQAIYALPADSAAIFVGQQVDVFVTTTTKPNTLSAR